MGIRANIEHLEGVICALEPLSMDEIPFIKAPSRRELEAMAGAQDRRFRLEPVQLPQDNGDSGAITQRATLEMKAIYRDTDEGLICATEDVTFLAYALRNPENYGRPNTTIINIEPNEADVSRVDEGRRGLVMSLSFDIIYLEESLI